MVETRSQRKKKSPAEAQAENLLAEEEKDPNNYDSEIVSRKHKRRSSRVDGNSSLTADGCVPKGQRDYFSELPVELHFEIASYLSAEELLRLSRVAHRLRAIFLSKSSRHAWTQCLSRLDAPPCPNELSEPKYASLLFEKWCESCLTSDSKKEVRSYFELRIRVCKECLYDKHVERGRLLMEECDKSFMMYPEVYMLVPHLNDEGLPLSHKKIFSLQEKRFVREEFYQAFERYRNAMSIGKSTEYFGVQKQKREVFVRSCVVIREWVKRREKEQKEEKSRLRSDRLESVYEAVEKRGYTMKETNGNAGGLRSKFAEVFEKEKFSDEDRQHIVLHLISTIERDRIAQREEQREQEHNSFILARRAEIRKHYRRYLQNAKLTFGERETFPIEKIVVSSPTVLDSIKHDDYSKAITFERFLNNMRAIEPELLKYRQQLLERHASILAVWHSESKQGCGAFNMDIPVTQIIYLASSFFTADEYSGPYYISPVSTCPAIIGKRKISSWFDQDDGEMNARAVERIRHYGLKCNGMSIEKKDEAFEFITVDRSAVEMARTLLKDLELPQSTMMVKMLDFGARFACLRCAKELWCGMSWVEMIEHYLQESAWSKEVKRKAYRNFDEKMIDDHFSDKHLPQVRILTDGELKRLHRKLASQRNFSNDERCKCQICEKHSLPAPLMTRRQVEIHIMKKHRMTTISQDDIRTSPPEELTAD